MIKVAILDDHTLVVKGLQSMLEQVRDLHIVACYTRAAEMMDRIGRDRPDVLLLDINLADANGMELCLALRKSYHWLNIIALSNLSEPGVIKNMFRNGALGYLLKNTDMEELSEAIRQVYKGHQFTPRSIREILLNDSLGNPVSSRFIPKLTRREKEVLDLIAREHTNSEIGDLLFISVKTVENHRNNLLQKFQVRNTAGLIKAAMQKGLLS